jgi:hypothetical protein
MSFDLAIQMNVELVINMVIMLRVGHTILIEQVGMPILLSFLPTKC